MRCACRCSASPATVNVTPREWRSNKTAPTAASRSVMRLLAAPTASNANSAPLLMLPLRATRLNSESEKRSRRWRFTWRCAGSALANDHHVIRARRVSVVIDKPVWRLDLEVHRVPGLQHVRLVVDVHGELALLDHHVLLRGNGVGRQHAR